MNTFNYTSYQIETLNKMIEHRRQLVVRYTRKINSPTVSADGKILYTETVRLYSEEILDLEARLNSL